MSNKKSNKSSSSHPRIHERTDYDRGNGSKEYVPLDKNRESRGVCFSEKNNALNWMKNNKE